MAQFDSRRWRMRLPVSKQQTCACLGRCLLMCALFVKLGSWALMSVGATFVSPVVHRPQRQYCEQTTSLRAYNQEPRGARPRASRLTALNGSAAGPAPTAAGLPGSDKVREFFKLPAAELSQSILVIVSSLVFACRTLPLNQRTDTALFVLDDFIQALFILEYLLRWYGANAAPSYLLKPEAVVDFLSFLPLAYSLLSGNLFLENSESLATFNKFDSFSLVRILKLSRFLSTRESFVALTEYVWEGASQVRTWQLELARTVYGITTLLFLASGAVYTFEHDKNPALPNFFITLYFGLTTLTTVGFGDITPITDEGRLVVCISILFGVGLVPLLLANLAQAFIGEFNPSKQEGVAVEKLASELLRFEDDGGDLGELFARIDGDRSGFISFVELYEAAVGEAFDDLSLFDVQRLRKALDDNGDGQVELVEVQNFVRWARRNQPTAVKAMSSAPKVVPKQVTISWHCRRCNETNHHAEAAFCFRCGTALRAPPTSDVAVEKAA